MSKFKVTRSWIGVVFLGLAHGILEDLMFIRILVEYTPADWDITGDLFFIFTVPLAQLMTFAITGTLAWHFLGTLAITEADYFLGLLGHRASNIPIVAITTRSKTLQSIWPGSPLWCVLVGLYARAKHTSARSVG